MARLSELLKTYRLINDPKAPDWNVKFAGAIFVVVLAAAAVLAVSLMPRAGDPQFAPETERAAAAEDDAATAGPVTEYVGYDLSTLGPDPTTDPRVVDAALDAWYAAHPGARVLATEPVTANGKLVGYNVVYEP